MLALRRIGRNRRAARRAIHCYRISHLQMLYVKVDAMPMPIPLHIDGEFVFQRFFSPRLRGKILLCALCVSVAKTLESFYKDVKNKPGGERTERQG